MKHLRRFLLALFAFVMGVALTPISFHVEGWACGRLIDGGGGFSSTAYTSSYSARVSFAHFNYSSKEKANEAFAQHLRDAVRVLETTTTLSEHGVITKRAVTISSDPETKQRFASISWTDGRTIHSIASPSLLHVIEFEKGILGEWRLGVRRIQFLLAPDWL